MRIVQLLCNPLGHLLHETIANNTVLFGSVVLDGYRYLGNACTILYVFVHTLSYSIIAKSSVDIDCELEILYSNTAHVYV